MYTVNPDGSDLQCFTDYDDVSHYNWLDDEHILAYGRHGVAGEHYYLCKDKTDEVAIVGDQILTEDGHPSYSPDRRWVLTDTYPDSRRFRFLHLFDSLRSRRYDIGRFFVPFLFDNEVRCDLHPRWSHDGQKICFDSVHEGRRRVYIMDASRLVSHQSYGVVV
jgi:Tol biopolymer transport system component